MDRESLLDTVRRLLALSSSPNEHEAKSAAGKAARLIAEHNIAMVDVDPKADGRWATADCGWFDHMEPEIDVTLQILHNYFFVRSIIGQNGGKEFDRSQPTNIGLFGEKDSLPSAQHAFTYLLETFGSLADAAEARGAARLPYLIGLRDGVIAGLKAERDQMVRENRAAGSALVRVDRHLSKALRSQHEQLEETDIKLEPEQKPATMGDVLSYAAGRQDGARVQVKKGETEAARVEAVG